MGFETDKQMLMLVRLSHTCIIILAVPGIPALGGLMGGAIGRLVAMWGIWGLGLDDELVLLDVLVVLLLWVILPPDLAVRVKW